MTVKAEDRGVERAAALAADERVRIAASDSVESLLETDFRLIINDTEYYVKSPPQVPTLDAYEVHSNCFQRLTQGRLCKCRCIGVISRKSVFTKIVACRAVPRGAQVDLFAPHRASSLTHPLVQNAMNSISYWKWGRFHECDGDVRRDVEETRCAIQSLIRFVGAAYRRRLRRPGVG
ncbi:Calcium uniporter protein, mitochondrial [Eumeta japonica]|uniref:Calcium uniporter protein, mitochondrial n=1 Tax=Eumeta variegata TaxID=151549 RepID=A0A4C1ZLX7_EUMVA|nr:Calcium uniporter protein, mitochondrial [Eumeta japonica]